MKQKIIKVLSLVAVLVAVIFGYNSLNASNEIICGNIESLTSGDIIVDKVERKAYLRLAGSEMENVCRLPNGYCADYSDCYGDGGTCLDIVIKPRK
ncbi:MAG: hypothetical protein IIU69_04325 [Bacteroidaceae bacterium]|nr:hypothetical protein [Bacteroidaceae bacterium]